MKLNELKQNSIWVFALRDISDMDPDPLSNVGIYSSKKIAVKHFLDEAGFAFKDGTMKELLDMTDEEFMDIASSNDNAKKEKLADKLAEAILEESNVLDNFYFVFNSLYIDE